MNLSTALSKAQGQRDDGLLTQEEYDYVVKGIKENFHKKSVSPPEPAQTGPPSTSLLGSFATLEEAKEFLSQRQCR